MLPFVLFRVRALYASIARPNDHGIDMAAVFVARAVRRRLEITSAIQIQRAARGHLARLLYQRMRRVCVHEIEEITRRFVLIRGSQLSSALQYLASFSSAQRSTVLMFLL